MNHKLSEVDPDTRRAICSVCGPTKIKTRDKTNATLAGQYRCKTVYKRNIQKSQYPYTLHKKDTCQHCGFVPEHSSQLDVDHIDGDRWNNDPANLQTLCANCHRLKTMQNEDWSENKKKPPTQDFS
jgi:5-methylcytosine-specific restriction endonuclease McrA